MWPSQNIWTLSTVRTFVDKWICVITNHRKSKQWYIHSETDFNQHTTILAYHHKEIYYSSVHPRFDAFQSDPLASCLTLIVTNLEFTGKAGRHLLGFGSVTSDNLHDRCRTPKEVSCNTFVDLFFSCSSLVVDDPQLPGKFFSPSDTLKKYPTILNLLQF